MTVEELIELFAEQDEYAMFERIENPRHHRPDVCAFIMLDELVKPEAQSGKYDDMVAAAEHDEIWLDVDLEKLAVVATKQIVRELRRCGVRIDRDNRSLAMFV